MESPTLGFHPKPNGDVTALGFAPQGKIVLAGGGDGRRLPTPPHFRVKAMS